ARVLGQPTTEHARPTPHLQDPVPGTEGHGLQQGADCPEVVGAAARFEHGDEAHGRAAEGNGTIAGAQQGEDRRSLGAVCGEARGRSAAACTYTGQTSVKDVTNSGRRSTRPVQSLSSRAAKCAWSSPRCARSCASRSST